MDILFTILYEVVVELGFGLLVSAVGHARERATRAHPLLAGLGCLVVGASGGALSALLVPSATPTAWRALWLLVVGPAATGTLLHAYGRWRAERGREASWIATFPGGALLAFAFGLCRYALTNS